MKTIILDRDGVINHDRDDFVKSPDEWLPIKGSLEAIARLNKAGYRVVIATNQSGIGRGLFDLNTLEKIHKKMNQLLAEKGGELAGIYFCPHIPDDHCDCRKPKAGLFKQAQEKFSIDFKQAYAIGDSLRDILAAQAAGCEAFLVKTGKGERTLASDEKALQSTRIFNNLSEVVDFLLAKE